MICKNCDKETSNTAYGYYLCPDCEKETVSYLYGSPLKRFLAGMKKILAFPFLCLVFIAAYIVSLFYPNWLKDIDYEEPFNFLKR